MAQQAQTTGSVVKEWIVTLIYVVVIAVVIRSFLFEPF
ncbi:MAG: signal peptidase I, partial [Proteobacteria bacterium]|nr:signal peptidase I [Pseudomonadota bacterium]